LVNWRQLLHSVTLLSVERQVGLVGELWVLTRLILRAGAGALAAWTGPLGELHDFRLATDEFEVKTTISATRSHMINGEGQLVASPGHRLFIVSIQLEPAGTGGRSLPELIERVAGLLTHSPGVAERFQEQLANVGYTEGDSALYAERWQLRNQPHLVVADETCPRITRAGIVTLDPKNSQRISEVHYRVNLEGLGAPAKSAQFQSILPLEIDEHDAL